MQRRLRSPRSCSVVVYSVSLLLLDFALWLVFGLPMDMIAAHGSLDAEGKSDQLMVCVPDVDGYWR
jgi:hypothetical protein